MVDQEDPPYPFGNYSRLFMLIVCTALNLLVYVDRGAFAGAIKNIEHDFDIDEAKCGFLGTAYLICYSISVNLFAVTDSRCKKREGTYFHL